MRAIQKAVDRFCYKHPRFGIPNLMKYVVFVSAAVYIFGLMDRTNTLFMYLNFDLARILRGEVWRLISWVFIPIYSSFLGETVGTAIALYFYYLIGTSLEQAWGTARFSVYYLMGIVINILYGVVASLVSGLLVSRVFLTPAYLNLSLFFAFAVLFPENRFLLFFIIPVKVKWLAIVNAAFFLLGIVSSLVLRDYLSALLPLVALLNFFIFCGSDVFGAVFRKRARRSKNTIHFKQATRKIRREEQQRSFRHKCAVCGKTDTEYPNLEFRYCSRCNGYHCFCVEHINNHIHFQ